jgi:hypothetical protein
MIGFSLLHPAWASKGDFDLPTPSDPIIILLGDKWPHLFPSERNQYGFLISQNVFLQPFCGCLAFPASSVGWSCVVLSSRFGLSGPVPSQKEAVGRPGGPSGAACMGELGEEQEAQGVLRAVPHFSGQSGGEDPSPVPDHSDGSSIVEGW